MRSAPNHTRRPPRLRRPSASGRFDQCSTPQPAHAAGDDPLGLPPEIPLWEPSDLDDLEPLPEPGDFWIEADDAG